MYRPPPNVHLLPQHTRLVQPLPRPTHLHWPLHGLARPAPRERAEHHHQLAVGALEDLVQLSLREDQGQVALHRLQGEGRQARGRSGAVGERAMLALMAIDPPSRAYG